MLVDKIEVVETWAFTVKFYIAICLKIFIINYWEKSDNVKVSTLNMEIIQQMVAIIIALSQVNIIIVLIWEHSFCVVKNEFIKKVIYN